MSVHRIRNVVMSKLAFWAAGHMCFGPFDGVRQGDHIQISYQRTTGPGILVNGTRYWSAS